MRSLRIRFLQTEITPAIHTAYTFSSWKCFSAAIKQFTLWRLRQKTVRRRSELNFTSCEAGNCHKTQVKERLCDLPVAMLTSMSNLKGGLYQKLLKTLKCMKTGTPVSVSAEGNETLNQRGCPVYPSTNKGERTNPVLLLHFPSNARKTPLAEPVSQHS